MKRIAFLVLQEHPYGRQMLLEIIRHGHIPSIVVEESTALALEEKNKFEIRIQGHDLPPSISDLCAQHNIERVEVPHHNKEECLQHLQRIQPDLLVLGGTRIIKGPVLSVYGYNMYNY
eukprot:NODE_5972_length_944_cov_39.946407_g5384_i0.p1 GENE.NODE_5972_length_944_cov_39.946407_g5384_i0~~NODE_5972_length_944_cov_39.946407_g5384_i0.p1  ORF type:complete len:118 (-),score=24.37 NODE_5972_length_944_cov_39.946407_g5384_i0:520-873(-)